MNTTEIPLNYTTGRVARICQVAPRTVSKWIDSELLDGYRLPGSKDRRVSHTALRAFLVANNMPLDRLPGEAKVSGAAVDAAPAAQ